MRAGDAEAGARRAARPVQQRAADGRTGALHGDRRECRRRRRRFLLLHVRVPRDQRRPRRSRSTSCASRRRCPASTPCSASDSMRASASCRNTCRRASARAKSPSPRVRTPTPAATARIAAGYTARELQMTVLIRAIAGALLLAVARRLRDHQHGHAGRPARAHEPRDAPLQRLRRPRACCRPVAIGYRKHVPQLVQDGHRQLPREPRVPDDHRERPAAAQDQGHADRPRALHGQLDARHRRHPRPRLRTSASRRTTRTSARPSAAGACRRAPTSCCRSSDRRPCGTRPSIFVDAQTDLRVALDLDQRPEWALVGISLVQPPLGAAAVRCAHSTRPTTATRSSGMPGCSGANTR